MHTRPNTKYKIEKVQIPIKYLPKVKTLTPQVYKYIPESCKEIFKKLLKKV